MTEKLYYEAFETEDGAWAWRIYHYNGTGDKKPELHRSADDFDSEVDALDDCVDFMEDNDIEAELS